MPRILWKKNYNNESMSLEIADEKKIWDLRIGRKKHSQLFCRVELCNSPHVIYSAQREMNEPNRPNDTFGRIHYLQYYCLNFYNLFSADKVWFIEI